MLKFWGVKAQGVSKHVKGTAKWFSGKGNRCYSVFRRREKVLLLSSGERNWCSTVLRRKKLVLYCSQEKNTGALLFSGAEKNTGVLLFSGKKHWCTAVLRKRKHDVFYCF